MIVFYVVMAWLIGTYITGTIVYAKTSDSDATALCILWPLFPVFGVMFLLAKLSEVTANYLRS